MIDESGRRYDGPDRRYWRRVGNRRVRKARLRRMLLRLCGLVAVQLAIGSVLAFGGLTAARRLAQRPEFTLRQLEFEGARKASPQALRASLVPLMGRSMVDLDLEEAAGRIASNSWVLEASLKRIVPDTLRVRVVERTPAALAAIRGAVHVVDTHGFVLGPLGPGLAYDHPVLVGLDALDGDALAAQITAGTEALARLRRAHPGFETEISEIDLSRPDRLIARLRKPGPPVFLDRTLPERNVSDFAALRGEIEDRTGPVEYFDLRWRGRITVRPALAPPDKEKD